MTPKADWPDDPCSVQEVLDAWDPTFGVRTQELGGDNPGSFSSRLRPLGRRPTWGVVALVG
jgi:hypothetical protein